MPCTTNVEQCNVAMYDFFRGQVIHLDNSGRVCLEVNNVGYALQISDTTRQSLPLDGSIITMYARLVVREDVMQLYGFADPAERVAFDLLTDVQGVGPKAAMAILSAYSVLELRGLLMKKDVAAMKKVKGIGAKGAERLVLELHDKIDRIPTPFLPDEDHGDTSVSAGTAADEVRQALVALGFSSKEAIDALAVCPDPDASSEELLREALQRLR